MKEILDTAQFDFPYTDLHFPGMNTGEQILFVTRESNVMRTFRITLLTGALLMFFMVGSFLLSRLELYVSGISFLRLILLCITGGVWFAGLWWVSVTHRKSVFIITNRRLTKIIYTTPFTWYQFSLGLDEIQDTGSYASSYIEAALGLGYFVARSGAAAIKNFKIVNISFAQDLHNYVNKLLYAFKHHPEHMQEFRPFIPHLKGEKRKQFLAAFPQYKTEF